MANSAANKELPTNPRNILRRWDLRGNHKLNLAVQRVFRLFDHGSMSSDHARTLAMLLRLSGEFYKAEKTDEIEKRIEKIEAALNIEHGLSIAK